MAKRALLLIALAFAAAACASLAAASPPSPAPPPVTPLATSPAAVAAPAAQRVVSGRYVVKLRDAARAAAGNPAAFAVVRDALAASAASVVSRYMQFDSDAFGSFVVINAPAYVAATLAAVPVVESVFQDFLLYPAVVRAAPLPPSAAAPMPSGGGGGGAGGLRGHARRLASRSGWNPALDRMDQRAGPVDGTFSYFSSAGGVTMDGAGVDVYVLDSGIRYDHAEFEGRVDTVLARNFVNDAQGFGSANASDSCLGHGTFVASQIAGAVVGVAPGARIVPLRVFSCSSSGSYSGLLAAVDYIVTTAPTTGRKSIVNFSGAANGSPYYDALAERLLAAGAPLINAAGNDGVNACTRSPARSTASFTVGASDASDVYASFSNYGACVNLTAVGVDNIGAWHTDAEAYAQGSGTSFASPIVAGLAATVWGALPAGTPWTTVTTILTASATAGRLTSLPAGTPNLLAYSGPVGGLAELAASVSPTPSATPTSSSTPSITPSASASPSITPSASGTPSITPTTSASRSLSATRTRSAAATKSASGSRKPASRPATPTRSRSRTRAAPKVVAVTKTRSASRKSKPRA
jgi:aqualysin 1